MRKSRFSDEQTIGVLKEHQAALAQGARSRNSDPEGAIAAAKTLLAMICRSSMPRLRKPWALPRANRATARDPLTDWIFWWVYQGSNLGPAD